MLDQLNPKHPYYMPCICTIRLVNLCTPSCVSGSAVLIPSADLLNGFVTSITSSNNITRNKSNINMRFLLRF